MKLDRHEFKGGEGKTLETDPEVPRYRKRKQRDEPRDWAVWWFHWVGQQSRNYACGSEERYWYAFKNYLDWTNGWLRGLDWIHR